MKKGLYIICVICMLHCVKLTAYADEGFSKFLDDIDIPKIECESHDIPSYSGFKSFMSYRLFDKKTPQYKLQQSAYTDEYGFRRIDSYYMIAVGKYFDSSIGQRIDLVLKNGQVIKCVLGDVKAVEDTDETNMFSINDCLSEFLVDTRNLEKTIKKRGDVSAFPAEEWDSPVSRVIIYDEFVGEEK